jgi:endonuclease G
MSTTDSRALRSALQARQYATARYHSNPRVTLIDVGWRLKGGKPTGQLAVRFHLRNKPQDVRFESFSEAFPALVIQKDEIPFDVVDIIESSYSLQWWPRYTTQPPVRGRSYDPLRGGISISNEWFNNYGTLGGIVEDRASGQLMLLSNWHVLLGSAYAPRGLRIFQPGRGDGGGSWDAVGTIERDVMVDGLDAAVARLSGNRSWSTDQFDIGPVNGLAMPSLGMHVVKSGRTSDVTEGIVDGIEGEFPIRYGGLLREIRHVCRVVPLDDEKPVVSSAGDSGSWWLEEDTHNVVALHFAGSDDPELALAMAMPPVFEALDVKLPGQTPASTTRAPEITFGELLPV